MKLKSLLPLLITGGFLVFLAVGLNRDPSTIPSPLIDKPAPLFNLTQLAAPELHFSPKDMQGQVWLLNVWASWCEACREEHPRLLEMARAKIVPVIGLDWKDGRAEGLQMLRQRGDPYLLSAFDDSGRAGIDYGVYGVPETYVIDQYGVIRYKHIGPITRDALDKIIYPLIKELKKS